MREATKVGHVVNNFLVKNKKREVIMKNVFFVEKIDKNLVSYGRVTASHAIVSKGNTSEILNKNNELTAVAYKMNNIYGMNSYIEKKYTHVSETVSCHMTSKENFYKMLGHVNFNYCVKAN